MYLDAAKFVLLSVFTLVETICLRISSKSRPMSAKNPLSADTRRSKTSLHELSSFLRTQHITILEPGTV